jgi:hypothetical protein
MTAPAGHHADTDSPRGARAAWLNQDLARPAAAQDWTAQALKWAHQRGDIGMVAWSIYRRSQQQLQAGQSRDAFGLAEAALRYDGQLGGPARAVAFDLQLVAPACPRTRSARATPR